MLNGSNCTKEDVKIMLESLYNRTVYPEVPEAINRLSKKYEVIIASNTDTEPLLQNFDYNGLVFGKIYTSEGLMAYKPNPKFYLTILNECSMSVIPVKRILSLHLNLELRPHWLTERSPGMSTVRLFR